MEKKWYVLRAMSGQENNSVVDRWKRNGMF